jgi:prophage regulatory protein
MDAIVLFPRRGEKVLGYGRTSLYDRLNPKSPHYDPEFPRPISLGPNRRGFLRAELDSYLEARVKASRAVSA